MTDSAIDCVKCKSTEKLEADIQRLREEFDCQRAKFKELFLQKEDLLLQKGKENDELQKKNLQLQKDLDDSKSQLVIANMTLQSKLETEKEKAENEIASLQRLIHETVEESSSSKTEHDTEIRRLQKTITTLENEIGTLKSERHSVQTKIGSLAPGATLSAVTKTLVKKLGADVFSSQDNDNSCSKIGSEDDHTKEDADVLRSLVIPLEEEIKALKDKLRKTDEQLQKCKLCCHNSEKEVTKVSGNSSLVNVSENKVTFNSQRLVADSSENFPDCDMCKNYEAQLVKEQQKVSELETKVLSAEKAAEKHREELLKELGFRQEMEEKWNEKKEMHKQQVSELSTRTECAEQDLKEIQVYFKQTCNELEQKLKEIVEDRIKITKELLRLKKENEHLVGKFNIHSQELQSEVINLPHTVEELQEVLLKTMQDIIIVTVAKETAEDQINKLRSDIILLKDQLVCEQQQKESLVASLTAEMNSLKMKYQTYEKEQHHFVLIKEKLAELQDSHHRILSQLEDISNEKRSLERRNNELKSRISSLQQELDNSEAVQKDFVRLSQSLQVQLEKIRDSDNQVRWQHEEDVEECPNCRISFLASIKRKKQNCRHCGQIYCTKCLSHIVNSGPNQRPSPVCDVCHTLLVKSSAPYFSTEVPHSPE